MSKWSATPLHSTISSRGLLSPDVRMALRSQGAGRKYEHPWLVMVALFRGVGRAAISVAELHAKRDTRPDVLVSCDWGHVNGYRCCVNACSHETDKLVHWEKRRASNVLEAVKDSYCFVCISCEEDNVAVIGDEGYLFDWSCLLGPCIREHRWILVS